MDRDRVASVEEIPLLAERVTQSIRAKRNDDGF